MVDVRRYDHGEIVGEPEKPWTWPRIAKWCHDELVLAREKRNGADSFTTTTIFYLSGRTRALEEFLTMLGTMKS